jgi:hypothetical protein
MMNLELDKTSDKFFNIAQFSRPFELLVIVFILMLSGTVHAQFSAGPTMGLSISTLNFRNLPDAGAKYTNYYFGGAQGRFMLSEKWGFRSDLIFIQKGAAYGEKKDTKNRYGYIEIIPEFEFYFKKYLGLGAGIHVGYKLFEEHINMGGAWTDVKDLDLIHNYNYGFTGSIFSTPYKPLQLFLKWNAGIFNISNFNFTDENGKIIDNTSIHTNSFQIGLSYLFTLADE